MQDRSHLGLRAAVLAALALVFNVSLAAAPVVAARLWGAIEAERAWGFHVTPATEERTRLIVERSLASLAKDDEAPAAEAWSALVIGELLENDVAAARGFLLAAPAALDTPDAARLKALIPLDGDDAAIAAAAASFLPEAAQADGARIALEAGAGRGGTLVIGDARDLAAQAAAFVRGEPVDALTFLLAGYVAVRPASPAAAQDEDIAAGAALVRAARRAGALTASFTAELERDLAAALPQDALRPALQQAAEAEAAGADFVGGVLAALRLSLVVERTRALDEVLAQLGRLTRPAGAAAAARVLPYAEDASDLPALALIAATGDRAIALAKHAPDREAFLAHARPTLKMSPAITSGILAAGGLLACALLSMLVTSAMLLKRQDARAPPARTQPKPPRRRPQADLSSAIAPAAPAPEPLGAPRSP